MALTAKQKKLPKALQKAILAKQKEKWQEGQYTHQAMVRRKNVPVRKVKGWYRWDENPDTVRIKIYKSKKASTKSS